MKISKLQRTVLLVTALGLLLFLANALLHPPVPFYLMWPVWTVLGLLIFIALFPTSEK